MKKIYFGICTIIAFLSFPLVSLANGGISSVRSVSVEKGKSISISFSASNAAGRVSVSSNNTNIASVSNSDFFLDNNSGAIIVNGNSVGNTVLNVKLNAATYDEEPLSGYSINVNVYEKSTPAPAPSSPSTPVKKQPTVQKKPEEKKSSNNYLKELSIDDVELSPSFNKEETKYTAKVPNDVSKIKINAWREDDKADFNGDGEKEVSEGENTFEIEVIAEDGSKRIYEIKVYVDSKPINIKVDGNDYTLIKNKEELPELKTEHEDLTLTISEQEIPAYRIDKLNYVLVGLRDSKGKVNLYRFISYKKDEKPAEYILYNEMNFYNQSLVLMNIPTDKIPSLYKKYTEKINDTEIEIYKLDKNSKYGIIYGLNIETGKENLYLYDSNENTVQIYNREEAKKIEEQLDEMNKLVYIFVGVIVFLLLLTTIAFTKKKKVVINNEELTKKDIKKIEKETKKSSKKRKKDEETFM